MTCGVTLTQTTRLRRQAQGQQSQKVGHVAESWAELGVLLTGTL